MFKAFRLWSAVKDVAEAFNRDLYLLEVLPQLRQPQNRGRYLTHDHIECDQFAHSQIAIYDGISAKEQDKGSCRFAHILDRVLAKGCQLHCLKRCLYIRRKPLLA